MIRLPRFLPTFATFCTIFLFVSASSIQAQAPRPGQPANEVDRELLRDVENFWHYAKIARYDLARQEAQKILARADQPVEVLRAFEQGPGQRDTLEEWLLRWQGIEEMREASTAIIRLLNEGRFTRRADPQHIIDNIRRLSGGERAYMLGIQRLRESGELAVPFMIDHLRNPQQRELHPFIRRALRDMGRSALNPLVAATEMQDGPTLVALASALGEIGYDVSVPYLVRLAQNSRYDEVRATAQTALGRLGVADVPGLDVADLFYDLGERFYYNNAAIAADPRHPVAYVWYWQENGLNKIDVPPAIFNEIMAMRACEYVLEHNPNHGGAVSLWLAANYNREIELPEGQVDRTRGDQQPDAHYYGVFAGTQYLNSALARAITDRNAPLALRVVQSLQEIVGESNLFAGNPDQPIIDAMRFPDRLVRYQAAFTLAAALPQGEFTGQGRVVPLLADALGQSGRTNILLLVPERDQLNRLLQGLGNGHGVAGGISADEALAQAQRLPAIDVIVISERVGINEIDNLLHHVSQDVRLEGTPRLMITETRASEWVRRAIHDPLLYTVTATAPEADPTILREAIESTHQAAAALPLTEQLATELALEAAELLERLAISRGQVLDVLVAEPALLRALDDQRPEVVIAAGRVLGVIDSRQAQPALLDKAVQDDTDDAVRIALYNSLASSAKFYGNRLGEQQIDALQRTVNEAPNLEVRSAAAEAHGALNLPADQARELISRQARR